MAHIEEIKQAVRACEQALLSLENVLFWRSGCREPTRRVQCGICRCASLTERATCAWAGLYSASLLLIAELVCFSAQAVIEARLHPSAAGR
jgi:hypothetical protein